MHVGGGDERRGGICGYVEILGQSHGDVGARVMVVRKTKRQSRDARASRAVPTPFGSSLRPNRHRPGTCRLKTTSLTRHITEEKKPSCGLVPRALPYQWKLHSLPICSALLSLLNYLTALEFTCTSWPDMNGTSEISVKYNWYRW